MQPKILPPDAIPSPDEKGWLLTELVETRTGLPGYRRIQRTYLMRNDQVYVWELDQGDSKSFEAPEFRQLSYDEHTVGELWDLADWNRDADHSKFFSNRMKELQGESQLIPGWLTWMEERVKLMKNQSHYGPVQSTQRDGFSLEGLKEKTDAST